MPYSLTLGSTQTGTISTNYEIDSYQVNFTAGRTYEVAMNGITLYDPYLQITDSTGRVVASNDDSNGTYNSFISFTPSASGAYTVKAKSYSSGTGTYSISAEEQSATSVPPVSTTTSSTTLSITGLTAELSEGNSGNTAFTFTVSRAGSLSSSSSVSWAVSSSGTNAASSADFGGTTFPTGVVTFAPGESNKTITVNVSGDTTYENDEVFTVGLSNAVGATLGTSGVSQTLSDYASGGYGVTEKYYTIASAGSGFSLNYQMYSIPDRADIYVNNNLVASTNGQVSNSGTLTVANSLNAGDIVKVVLTGTDTNTAWDFSVNYSGGVQSLNYMANGVIKNDDSNVTLPANVSTGTTNAKVFLGSGGDYFTIASSGTRLIAASGNDTVAIQAGVTNVTLDQNLETLQLTGKSTDYLYQQAGNTLKIYSSSQSLIVTTVPQGDTDGLQIAFADGTVMAKLQSGVMHLGAATLTSGINSISPYANNSVSVNSAGSSDASSANTTYNISSNTTYTYTISGFSTGDILDFTSNEATSIQNKDYTDGEVEIACGNSSTGTAVTIVLTGLSSQQDPYLNSAIDFNALFGAGTLI